MTYKYTLRKDSRAVFKNRRHDTYYRMDYSFKDARDSTYKLWVGSSFIAARTLQKRIQQETGELFYIYQNEERIEQAI